MSPRTRTRCGWAGTSDPLYLAYHDEEWGAPVHDDRRQFEFLILEGAQAGFGAGPRSSTSARAIAKPSPISTSSAWRASTSARSRG